MTFVYTKHAKKRMIERGISEKQLVDCVDYPEYTIKRGEEIEAYKKTEEKMLKVVYVNMIRYIKVITVYYL